MNAVPLQARIGLAVLLFFVPVVLTMLAVPRFLAGLGMEEAHALARKAIVGASLTPSEARAAAASYSGVSSDDGDGLAQRAEFVAFGSANDPAVLSQARAMFVQSLKHAPANPRAWTALCEIDASRSPQDAVRCLDKAISVAPFDWYIAGWRMSLLAREWPYLDERLRDRAIAAVLPIWTNTEWPDNRSLRPVLFDLSRTENGRQLLRAGLMSDREALRAFNRYIVQERLNGR